ncbi:hypothetical protein MYX84_05250 [Acidobacteria bacterium AH-259-O06]|nr:hypothetical protein [Acidobacteria bacterium AH-259-O06]
MERDTLGGIDSLPRQVLSAPSLTTVVLENGEQIDPVVLHAALDYLKIRQQSFLTVWDVINDPLLREFLQGETASEDWQNEPELFVVLAIQTLDH